MSTSTSKSASALPTFLHVDMDAFFASVEALVHPELRNKPLIVGGDGDRGVVASCSYEARFYGVRSAMPSMRAKRLCPHAVFVHGNFHLYEQYSKRMHEVFQSFTPLIEPLSLDEAFLDVSGAQRLFGSPEEIAWGIRTKLREELGLDASVGVATTKHVAKLASVAAKPIATKTGAEPGKGVFVVTAEDAIPFLHSLPVRALWGVGPKAGERLARIGITTVAQLAAIPVQQLAVSIGASAAQHLHDLAWNIDRRSIVTEREAKSVGHEQTFATDLSSREQVHDQFVRQADAVTTRLRKAQLAGRTLTVKIRYGNFETITRSKTVPKATANAAALVRLADEATASLDFTRGVRLVGLSMSKIESAVVVQQLNMLDVPLEEDTVDIEDDRLDDTIDAIRARYGASAVVPAPFVGEKSQGVLRRGQQQWGPGKSS